MSDIPAWLHIAESSARVLLPIVACLAAIVGWKSYHQRRLADNRAEWWRRVSNAIDLCATDDDRIGRNTGMTLMNHLLTDPTATQADAKMLEDVVNTLINEIVHRP
ncbi:MAG: hypothetical protein L0G94_03940 [Brachybacterium sp.]|uniref:hypothetical protein n=1 Tax=Brachybacterium sp. TaxID=1891286 RepID=UPI0026487769|nr:hypothetical protein [Brachybacterium sp.]MDN5685821.1 hypothetical protein [Brachybacterium sp.]